MPVLGERQAAFVDGRGQTYLADFSAESDTVYDPDIRDTFDGIRVLARVRPSGEDCIVDVRLTETAVAALRLAKQVDTSFGSIEAPTVRNAELVRSLRLTPGDSAELGSGVDRKLDGKLYRTRWVLALQ